MSAKNLNLVFAWRVYFDTRRMAGWWKIYVFISFHDCVGWGVGWWGGCDERMSRTGHVCLAWLLFPDIKKYETVFHQLSSFFSFVIFFLKCLNFLFLFWKKKQVPSVVACHIS
jgi:hypothetical protein